MLFFDLRDEWTLTERLRKAVRVPPGSELKAGIGDDCAIFRPRGATEDLLFTCDLFSEGVHFLRESISPVDAGRRALSRSLSDIAAMGGSPRCCLVALCAGKATDKWDDASWIDRFFDGILAAASESGALLAGGDLSRGEQFICDVTVCGAVPRGKALLRSGARPGDQIYVSGALGGAALKLLKKKYLPIIPRLRLATYARENLRATAAMDLSDGLSLDLRRLCLASGVAAEITNPPRFRGATPEQALHGGEDYELLFTVPKGTAVPATFDGVKLTCIGRVVRSSTPGGVLLSGLALEPRGYDHFGSPDAVKLEKFKL